MAGGPSLVRIATRASAQAIRQSEFVADSLRALGVDVELVHVNTFGDRTQRAGTPLHSIGGQGVFVKEVQQAVLDGNAELAVHSAKDLPSIPAAGLTIGAFCERRSASDVLIGLGLDQLETGATVATGSVRRRAQLRRSRSDLQFAELRGNIHTRLEKIPDNGAIVMAEAALQVLDLTERIAQRLAADEFVPAVGQGCVAVECADHNTAVAELLAQIDHPATRRAVTIERAFLAELGSGCSLPVGGYVEGNVLHTFLANEAADLAVTDSIEIDDDVNAAIAIARLAAHSAREAVGGG